MTILLNGDIWSRTRMWDQSSTGELSLELSGYSLNGGTWSVTRKTNKSRTRGLSLGLRAILQENGGTWSVTKYLTLSHLMQPGHEAPGQLPGRHHKP